MLGSKCNKANNVKGGGGISEKEGEIPEDSRGQKGHSQLCFCGNNCGHRKSHRNIYFKCVCGGDPVKKQAPERGEDEEEKEEDGLYLRLTCTLVCVGVRP